MLSAMPLSPQTPPRSSRMSCRSSTGTASSRGTTLKRYGPVPSSLPPCCWQLPAACQVPQLKAARRRQVCLSAPHLSPRPCFWDWGRCSHRLGASFPVLGHPGDQAFRVAIPPHPTDAGRTLQPCCCPVVAAGCLAESILGHLLARQKLGGTYSFFSQKQIILLLPVWGQGKALCLLVLAWGRLGLFFPSGAFRETY